METWFLIVVTASLAALLRAFLSLKPKSKLPPGPQGVPILSSLKWLGKSSTEIEAILRSLRSRFGPIVTLPIGPRSLIFVCSHDLAHQALVQKGAVFADRPKQSPATKQLNISFSGYGPTWRTLRRNLTSHILHHSQVKEFSHARKWALEILFTRLVSLSSSNDAPSGVKVVDHFQLALFSLLVLMCFGHKLEEPKIQEIEQVQRQLLLSFNRFRVLNFWPRLTRVLLRSRWDEFFSLRKKQKEVLIPLIRARKHEQTSKPFTSYVDTLSNLEIQDEQSNTKRKLTEEEMVGACSEFLDGGIETTTTALQWIMANLVKYPEIQAKLFLEIKGVVGDGEEAEEVGEEHLAKMPYLKAVVLEGLRRHPPGHFVLPHSVSQDIELGGYLVPKNTIINFTVAEMNWDPKVWEDPMEFKPERFLSAKEGSDGDGLGEFDVTGSREIKMMTFGAGRRVCPGFGLAILHLEYFVANLVWKFEWAVAEGHEVDLSEKQEFTIVMEHPLQARISPRRV